MKKNDTGDFSILYIEPEDERTTLLPVIAEQKKPVVLMLADQARIFQRPDEFTILKHVRRQHDLTIIFVIPHGGQLAQMASRNGFPVYLSMESLVSAVGSGQMTRPRPANRNTVPLQPSRPSRPLPEKPVQALPPVEPVIEPPARPVYVPPVEPRVLPHPIPEPGQAAMPLPPRRLPMTLVIFTTVMLALIVGSFVFIPTLLPKQSPLSTTQATPGTKTAHAGRVVFASSGQVSEDNSNGISDKVVVDLDTIANPTPGKSYYAWLLVDKKQLDTKSVALGKLPVVNGKARLVYDGDAQHTNLLVNMGRVLVTEEDADVPPISPSPDMSTWRYYGEFLNTPIQTTDNGKKYGYLDHIRHLLAADPTLQQLELYGGLNNWFYRNTIKILEWASSTREHWEANQDVDAIRRQSIRILSYLDGSTFLFQDLPANTPLLVSERLARVGLLTVNGPNQEPPSYFTHIDHHLRGLLAASDATPAMRKQIAELISSLNYINLSLSEVRKSAQKIVKMSNTELKQAGTLALLNDMITHANNAYTGDVDPMTDTTRQGVTWLQRNMQNLATLEVTTVPANLKE